MVKNIKLIIEYDGTNYSGWQSQKGRFRTLQETIENIIKEITEEDIELIGCSRTDAGVHAKGFVANFLTNSRIPGDKFKYAINSRLPEDIIILNSDEVDLEFHSRYSCISKRYIYKILNTEWPSPINRYYTYHVQKKLNVLDMNEAARYFQGTHDFSSFKNIGSSVKTSVRTIIESKVYMDDEMICFSITGNGFLYNMVRIITGTLIEVGMGKRKPEDMSVILSAKDRNMAGKSVPPTGLYLDRVFY